MKFKVTKIKRVESEWFMGRYYQEVHLKFEDGTKDSFAWYPERGPLTEGKIAVGAQWLYNQRRMREGECETKASLIERAKQFIGQKFRTAEVVK